MKKSDTHAFVNQLVIYTLGLICFSGSIGLGTVWLRHQISLSANATRVLEARLNEVERHQAQINADIEIEQRPEMLEMRNKKLALGLQQPTPQQVQHIDVNPTQHLAAKRNRDLFSDGPAAVSFHVALKN